MIMLIILSVFIGIGTDILLMKTLKIKKYPCTFILSLLATFILYKAFDSQLMIIKGFLFSQILIFTGYIDAKTRTIPDKIHIAIMLVALIGIDPLASVFGLIFVPLPFLVAAMIENGAIGGGDIKIMGACGFLLGVMGGYIASFIGLTLAVAFSKVFLKDKDDNGIKTISTGIPLAPYLGIGSILAYIIH